MEDKKMSYFRCGSVKDKTETDVNGNRPNSRGTVIRDWVLFQK